MTTAAESMTIPPNLALYLTILADCLGNTTDRERFITTVEGATQLLAFTIDIPGFPPKGEPFDWCADIRVAWGDMKDWPEGHFPKIFKLFEMAATARDPNWNEATEPPPTLEGGAS